VLLLENLPEHPALPLAVPLLLGLAVELELVAPLLVLLGKLPEHRALYLYPSCFTCF
jgi:hypothetical protein